MANAGYTFVDNSQLSITEKIKLYFAKNPSNITHSANSSSSSSSSFDMNQSLLQSLEETKHKSMASRRKKLNFDESTVESKFNVIDLSSPTPLSPLSALKRNTNQEQQIDLCTPPQQHSLIDLTCLSNTPTSSVKCSESPKILDFSSYPLKSSSIDAPSPTKLPSANSSFYRGNESFLEMEKWCEIETPNTSIVTSPQKSNFSNDTHLSDIDEPSGLWNDTKIEMSPFKKMEFNRPSTIIEESTQCSSSNGSNVDNMSLSSSSKAHEHSNKNLITPSKRLNDEDKIHAATNEEQLLKLNTFFSTNRQPSPSIWPKHEIQIPLVKNHQFSNKENVQVNVKMPAKKLPTYRESIFNVFPKNKPKRQYYDSPEAAEPMKKLEKTISLMSLNDYDNYLPASVPRRRSNSFDSMYMQSPNAVSLSTTSSPQIDKSRDLNDTMEAVDFFIEQGRKLQQSAKKTTPFSPKLRNLLSSSTTPSIKKKMMKTRTPTEILRANYHRRHNLMNNTVMDMHTKDK